MDAQTAAAAADAATTKRLKKREIDRRCQREARQRTKSRIAYLEGLVEELRRKDTSGQVASLMKQVAEVRKERDMFARTLRGIEDSIRGHRSLLEGVPSQTHKNESASPPSIEQDDGSDDAMDAPMMDSATGTETRGTAATSSSSSGSRWPNNGRTIATNHLATMNGNPNGLQPGAMMAISTGLEPSAMDWTLGPATAADPSPTSGVPFFPNGKCECCAPLTMDDMSDASVARMQSKNVWSFAHSILDKPPVLTPKVLRWEDEHSDDVPIRAIAEGWAAVETRLGGHLPPLWRKLRSIDEVVFSDIGKIERLAILRVMHWLMRYHADPASQSAKIPPWYFAR